VLIWHSACSPLVPCFQLQINRKVRFCPVAVLGPDRGTQPPSFAPAPPFSFVATHDFFAQITQIFDFFAFTNGRKVDKFAASIKCPKTKSASASGRLRPSSLTRGSPPGLR